MNILITGGTGFVGSVFCRLLTDEGHYCTCFDLHEPSSELSNNSNVKFIQGDVRDIAALNKAMVGVDAVIHLAAAHHDFGISEQTFHDVNVGGMSNVCDSMQQHGVRKLCFFSTVALYGKQDTPPTETTEPKPNSPYGSTKLAAEKVCIQWCEADQANQCLVMRPTVIFGPNSFANMYSLIRQIDSGKFLRVGKMANIKSLAFVDNIVSTSINLWIKKMETGDDLLSATYTNPITEVYDQLIKANVDPALYLQEKVKQETANFHTISHTKGITFHPMTLYDIAN
ncbi:MAG: NAD(P)-dependent oxidoreductase, partial [Planctomycetaceae bacterium]|nr:NAD(P)-dependent oxidoreductase [Planctomycetaceae bacterium]